MPNTPFNQQVQYPWDPGAGNPYRSPVPQPAPAVPPPVAPSPPPAAIPPPNIPPTRPTPPPIAVPAASELDRAISESGDNAIKAAWINFATALFGAPNNPGMIESARTRPLERLQMLQRQRQQRAEEEERVRQARIQQLAAERAGAAEGRAVAAEGRASTDWQQKQAMRDPTSPQSQQWRERFKATYPDVVKALPQGMFDNLSPADMDKGTLLAMAIEDARKQREMGLGSELRQKEYEARKEFELKKSALQGRGIGEAERAMGGTTPQGGFANKTDAITTTIINQFPEGWFDNGQHPEDMASIKSLYGGNFKTGTANKVILDAITDRAKLAHQLTEGAGQKYADDIKQAGIDKAWAAITNVRDAIYAARKKHGSDIPGVGVTYSLTSALGPAGQRLLSQEGRDIQRAVKDLLDTKLRISTGAAAPESEYKTFSEILGASAWNSDQDLLNGVELARKKLAELDASIARGVPDSGIKWYDRHGGRGWLRPIDFSRPIRKVPEGFELVK